jgi:hypothetical protein
VREGGEWNGLTEKDKRLKKLLSTCLHKTTHLPLRQVVLYFSYFLYKSGLLKIKKWVVMLFSVSDKYR